MGDVVVVLGPAGPVRAGLLARLVDDPDVERVAVVGPTDPSAAGAAAARESTTITWAGPEALADLSAVLTGATGVVLLGAPFATGPGRAGSGGRPSLDGTGSRPDVGLARAVLEAADMTGTPHLVLLSSALVYGAWANNPVPLTEQAALRPDPAVPDAVRWAEVERLADEWRREHPGATVAVLRPTITVAPAAAAQAPGSVPLDRTPWVPHRWRTADDGPPVQYLRDDDLAAALHVAVRRRLAGALNVAPEGWISAEDVAALAGPRPPVHVPAPVAGALTALRLRRGGYPAALVSYLQHPWVVASDRLRAAGWAPADSNEEAFVEAYAGGPFAAMDARRRQLLSFGAIGAVVAALAAAVALLVRRRR